jgi:PAS domain S-box-containing protein
MPPTQVRVPVWIWWGGGSLLALGLVLAAWTLSLKAQMAAKTEHLEAEVSERRREQEMRTVTIDLLRILNSSTGRQDLIRSIVTFLRNWLGCDAVGIRLREGDDFPYFEVSGFSDDFVQSERQLCSRDAKGETLRDQSGNPVLDCMCGNVIRGLFDPTRPFFTEKGSFWSNCTTELLASTTEADRQARTRNRCNGEGYESVGLFPLSFGGTTFGLLQVNDRRKGLFDPWKLSALEGLGDNLAIALSQVLAREALSASEDKYRNLFDNAEVGMFRTRLDGSEILEFNERYLRIFGRTREEMQGGAVFTHWADQGEREDMIGRLMKDGNVKDFECRMLTKGGQERTCLASLHLVADTGILEGSILDITERKQAEQQIRKALSEKETLLHELYHRTKNNMGMINALLGLQAGHSDDENLKRAFAEAQDRIISMALVHEKLYETKDLSHINLKDYILGLARLLMDSYGISQGRVALAFDMDDVLISIDIAIPCGLILNEIITNAIKYAFPSGRSGTIRVDLHRSETGAIRLLVSDDGVGVPPGFDARRDGRMGIQTILELAERQLEGEVHVSTEKGVAYRMEFADDCYRPRV